MNLLPSEVSLQMRFDAFCKKVITYTNYKLLREGQKRREQGYVFSDFEEGGAGTILLYLRYISGIGVKDRTGAYQGIYRKWNAVSGIAFTAEEKIGNYNS